MPKISVVIADEDGGYLKRLTDYLTENNKQLEISSFTDKESLLKYIKSVRSKINILLYTEEMYSAELEEGNAELIVKLAEGEYDTGRHKTINKYCRADSLTENILMEYADYSGRMDVIGTDGGEGSMTIGVYSPVGGSGKTVIALALAKELARLGKEVLYLNFEGISSVGELLSGQGKWNMSDVYLESQNKKAKLGLKLMQCKEQHYETGIYYINPPERATEYCELEPKELARIISDTKMTGKFDVMVADFNSGYYNDNLSLLETCDVIIVPFVKNENSISKMKLFAQELQGHEKLYSISKRMIAVENRSRAVSTESFGSLAVKAAVPESTTMSSAQSVLEYDSAQALRGLMKLFM